MRTGAKITSREDKLIKVCIKLKLSTKNYLCIITWVVGWYSNFQLAKKVQSHPQLSYCCDWDRVTCNATSNHVTAISLNYTTGYPLNFTGIVCTLNLSLFHPFQELVALDLSHNRFYAWSRNGGFERLSSLKKLQVLDLSSNLFNGSILSSVSKLISIKTLILGRNSLTDSLISNELGSLENLEVLDLSYNQFNQTSSLEGLCGLRSLRELGLSYNNFFGHLPPCLGNLTNLQVLDLSFNQFSGSIQHVVSSLTSLKYLFLSGNQFEGLFSFSSLANHTLLEIFELSSGSTMLELETETPLWSPTFQLKVIDLPSANLNVQTRTFPSFLRYQHDLQFIDLSHNRLVGSFPSWILQNNSKLKVLNLMNNSFTGNFELPEVKHGLSYLEISSNNITGQLPEEIGIALVNLIHMNLSKNNFEGNIPSSVGAMEVLLVLDLSNNNLSGIVPASLFSKLTSLDSLVLSNNSFQGDIFPQIVNMPSLIVLDMRNNNFTGNSDPHLLYLPSLVILDISKNKIAGTIYVQLCNLGSLELLDLSQNMFSGSLPSCFNASTLRYLFLQKNTLSGPIPHILSRISNLVTLDLRDNNFSGTIPSWISQFSGLRVLLFGGNALQGHIPPQLCQLRSLNILDLSHNSLYGSIPSCLNNISFGMMEEDDFSSSPVEVAYASPKSYYAYFNASLDMQPPGIPSGGSRI
ncbi:receptor-like protein 9a [Mercurialis annua]|uniref:receptor-like protein 9a n=1 Tax=Mercurialis annua TaxID=3986 RepID=UPI0024ADA3E1|nr:receptor-like protein 9a [Mercurialis annua]